MIIQHIFPRPRAVTSNIDSNTYPMHMEYILVIETSDGKYMEYRAHDYELATYDKV
jgi:hypothetical protein